MEHSPAGAAVRSPSFTGEELFSALERAAETRPDEPAVHLVHDGSRACSTLTRATVLQLARRGAAFYRSRGLEKGDRILLELPGGEGYLGAVLGALYAGMIPATVAPLLRSRSAARAEWKHLHDLFRPRLVVAEHEGEDGEVSVNDVLASDAAESGERVHGGAMSYVQFSSGSTGDPKALLLTMPGIVSNLDAMSRRIPIAPDDHCVTWLPMHHDMGLFGSLLLPLYRSIELTLIDTAVFTRTPLVWLKRIHEVRASVTVGTPSAFKLTLDLLRRRPQKGMDLSCCTRFLCGAEQVTPRLAREFEEVLGPYLAPVRALKPVYGMSEVTLAATMPLAGEAPVVDWVDRRRFEARGCAVPVETPDEASLGWVSVGGVLEGQELRVVSESGEDLPDRHVGRLLLRSPSLYRAEIRGGAVIPSSGEWLDTGDLGYRADERAYVTGRARDIIIKGGRNYSPERLEELAMTVEGVSRAAAFGVYRDDRQTERVVVLVEVRPRFGRDAGQRDQLRLAVRAELSAAGYFVDEVVLVTRGALPRTTSGKLRRRTAKRIYSDGGWVHESQH